MALCNSKSPTHFRIQQSQSVLFHNSHRLTIFVFVLFPFANSISFEFSNFQSNGQLITYQGDAVAANAVIELTNALDTDSFTRIGRASYADPVHLWDSITGNLTDFSTKFQFIITPSNNTNLGDGLTFFLSAYNASIPINPVGGLLGLFNSTDPGYTNNQIVAVEFDTKQDSWDNCTYHVGIDVNSIESVNYTQLDDSLANGTIRDAWVTYDSTAKTLDACLSYDGGQTYFKLSHVIDLSNVLPEWVSVGFSASLPTSSTERHTITSWQFNSSYGIVGESSNSASEPSPSNSTSGTSPSTITAHKTNPRVGVYLSLGIIGSLILGVVLFLSIRMKCQGTSQARDQNQVLPQTSEGSYEGSSQGSSHETNTDTSVGNTNAGGDVNLEGNGISYGNTYYNNNYNHVLPSVLEEKYLLKLEASEA